MRWRGRPSLGEHPNGYTPDASLSDAGAQPRSRFSGVALDNLYANGRQRIAAMPLEWTLGYQKLDWGNRFLVLGGLRDLNPIDIPALTRPGMLQREQETRIPVPQIFARLGVSASTSIEGFYQFGFERNAPNQCGTFYSGVDWYSDGCNAVTVGAGSDRAALASGSFLKRADNVMPGGGGQFGAALTHTVDAWATKFGVYATQFHSRTGYSGVIKSLRTAGAPFVPGDPDGLNPKYVTEFPADVRMFGLTFETRFAGGTAFGELTYRPNQPLQFNAADLLGAVLSPVAPTTLRSQERALPPGGTLNGFERHKNVQLQLGAVGQVAGVLPGATVNWGAEIVYKGVPDLPDPSVTRFGRVDVFGQGPVNGVCPAPAAPTQCTSDGYVSRHAFGYRLVVGARYADVAEGIDLIPSMLFGHDVSGWSGDTAILEGRKLAIVSLRANWRSGSPPTSHGFRPGAARTTTSAIAAPCSCRSAVDSDDTMTNVSSNAQFVSAIFEEVAKGMASPSERRAIRRRQDDECSFSHAAELRQCAGVRSRHPHGLSDPRTRAAQSNHLRRILDRLPGGSPRVRTLDRHHGHHPFRLLPGKGARNHRRPARPRCPCRRGDPLERGSH
jgi:hypothetical protein